MFESFTTERLFASRITPAAFEDVCRLHRDPTVMATLSADGRPLPDEVTRDGLVQADLHWKKYNFGLWVFHDRLDGGFVGRGGLKAHAVEGREVVGLAYAVVSARSGRGFATEMGRASLAVGFDGIGLEEIDSWTLPANRASQRIMQKLGYVYDRDFEFAGLPHRYYRLCAGAWRGWPA